MDYTPVADSTTDWISAIATVLLLAVAAIGFFVTIRTVIDTRNRQRLELEGYVRVDIGPPDGTEDFNPPDPISWVEGDRLISLAGAVEGSPMMSVWYRNLQTHPLGIALGVVGRIMVEVTDNEGQVHEIDQTHDIAYIEPGRCVRVDVTRFPANWKAVASLEAVRYKNLDWDGTTSRHGRLICTYADGGFQMVPFSDPSDSWRDRLARSVEWVGSLLRAEG